MLLYMQTMYDYEWLDVFIAMLRAILMWWSQMLNLIQEKNIYIFGEFGLLSLPKQTERF